MPGEGRTIELPVRYYCGAPAATPRGLVTESWTLGLERTALIELHCWDIGFPNGPPVPPDYWVFMGSLQTHERMVPIVREVIAPVLDAGRAAGMPVVHVQGESIARRYPGLEPPRPEEPPRASGPRPVSADPVRRAEQVHGEGYREWDGWDRVDVASPVRPRPGDTMIVSTEQFDAWLREREITTLIYTGFCTNLCILDSPAAMKAMRDRGYRCVLLREATLACEFPDTLESLAHTRASIQYIEAWVGYSAGVGDFRRALAGVTGT